MPNTARITVITPTLNAEDTLEPCLCSILDQEVRAEIIVIDGGSTDTTIDLVRRYENDIADWHQGHDLGPADAVNHALTRATGDLVVILPADTSMLPGTLAAIRRTHARARNAAWMIGHACQVNRRGRTLAETAPRRPGGLLPWLMHDAAPIAPGAAVYRRDIFDRLGPFDPTLAPAWRYEMHARMLADGITPMILAHTMVAIPAATVHRPIERLLARGMAEIAAAERHIDRLEPAQRPALWRNLDQRRQIYALVEAEAAGADGPALLERRVMARPWWLHSHRIRRALAAPDARWRRRAA